MSLAEPIMLYATFAVVLGVALMGAALAVAVWRKK